MSGDGLASGAGGALGTALAVGLAPETGGLSMAGLAGLGALGGAGGAELGNLVTGNKVNPLQAALMGGIGGGLSGGVASDMGWALPDATSQALNGTETSILPGTVPASAPITVSDLPALAGNNVANAAQGAGSSLTSGTQNFLNSLLPSSGTDAATAALNGTETSALPSAANAAQGASSAGRYGSNIMNWASKNPLQALVGGTMGASALQNLFSPKPKVNIANNAANVLATNPSFNNPNLPKYNMANTASPYQGNWYNYGMQPEQAMYNAQPTLAQKEGGLVEHKYAHGGAVHGLAMGGNPQGMPMPQNPLQPQAPMQAQGINPLMLQKVHQIGVAIGKHLKEHGYNPNATPDGQVHGKGGGQDDLVPAKLSQDEYVLSADIPAALGDGSSNEGAKILDKFVANVRAHKTSNSGKFPPKAKNPLKYLPKKAQA